MVLQSQRNKPLYNPHTHVHRYKDVPGQQALPDWDEVNLRSIYKRQCVKFSQKSEISVKLHTAQVYRMEHRGSAAISQLQSDDS